MLDGIIEHNKILTEICLETDIRGGRARTLLTIRNLTPASLP